MSDSDLRTLWPETCDGRWMREEYERGLVSVIVPTFNRADFLIEAMDSVFQQTYRPIELLVIDDGSTDDTAEVVARWEKQKGRNEGFRLRYFRQENSGACSARNRGLCLSRGEFLNFLDSDDLLISEAVSWKVNSLSNPSFDFAYGISEARDSTGRLRNQFGLDWPNEHRARIAAYLFHTNSPLIRRAVCMRTGPWDETLKGGQEIEYFSRLKAQGHVGVFLNRPTDIYRMHSGPSISQAASLAHGLSFLSVGNHIYDLIHSVACNRKAEMYCLSNFYLHLAFRWHICNEDIQALCCMKRAYSLQNRNWKLLLALALSKILPPHTALALRYTGYSIRRYLGIPRQQ